jgi:hypothetical protein
VRREMVAEGSKPTTSTEPSTAMRSTPKGKSAALRRRADLHGRFRDA